MNVIHFYRPQLYLLGLWLSFLMIWGPGLSSPYQYDDYLTPLQDPASQSIGAWFQHFFATMRPLTKFTYALESSSGLTTAFARRITSYLLALLCAGSLFQLIYKKSGHLNTAMILTLLWVSHPVHSETFISLAGRSTLLATLFIILSLKTERMGSRILLAFLAVLAKEVALLFFFYQVIRSIKHNRQRALLLLIPAIIIVLMFNERLMQLLFYSWKEAIHLVNWWEGPAAIIAGWYYYLMPFSVNVDPEFPLFASALWFFLSALLLIFCCWRCLKANQTAITGVILLWLVLILPTQSIIPKLDALSLRPLSFAYLALPFLLLELTKRFPRLPFILIPFIIISGMASFQLSTIYQNEVALWAHSARKTTTKVRPLINQAYFLVRDGKLIEAKDVLTKASLRDPDNFEVRERLRALETLIESKAL